MPRGNVALLVLLYCLKTLGWVATTVGVFLALSYLRSRLLSAWKKEIEGSSNSRERNDDVDDFSATDSRTDVENTEEGRNSLFGANTSGTQSSSVVSSAPKNDLPPRYEDVMYHKNGDLTVRSSNACSIQNESSIPFYSCVCHEAINSTGDSRSEQSKYNSQQNIHSIEINNLTRYPSTSCQARSTNISRFNPPCNGCGGTTFLPELPLVEGVTKLNAQCGNLPGGDGISNQCTDERMDDETQPPPSYSDLFEKPSNSSISNLYC